jgi:lactose/L-arabinose transport system ATP-binding protein
MRLEIAKLHKDLGATMIYVTHDQVEAMTLADKIVVLRLGRVEQVGSPLELYHDPDNMFVAGFLGSPKINFLKAVVERSEEGRLVVVLPDFRHTEVPLAITGAHPGKGAELVLGIRPEHLGADGKVVLEVRVDVLENLGGVAFAYANSGYEQQFVVELKNRNAEEGEMLKAGFDPASALLFDPKTGRRIR